MTLNDLEPSQKGFLHNFALRHAFQEWIAPKWREIDNDNLHMKFAALNVSFNGLGPNPLR